MSIEVLAFLVLAAVFFIITAVRILPEYERGVVLTFGRYTHTVGPGLFILIPIVQTMIRVDIRVQTQEIPSQDVISRDNVSVKVSAVVYFRVINPAQALLKTNDYYLATIEMAQTTLRSVLGKHELDDMLSKRDQLNKDILEIVDQATEGWGIKISDVAIKHIDIDPSMIRAIARQAEAERERRAKIINAEGELQAAQKLDEAAQILSQRSESMQLRYLSALTDIASDKTNTIILPVPDILQMLMRTATPDKTPRA